MLLHKQNLAQQAKKKQAAKQKEAQKREADSLSRKHLAGLRVRQKNLVYVTGLKPKVSGEKLVEGLRGKEFFGQYGDIVKIVVSKSKDVHVGNNPPIAIYVTFVRKEDAATCINIIDNHKQADGTRLRYVFVLCQLQHTNFPKGSIWYHQVLLCIPSRRYLFE
jgi:CCR4-NOT transcription complex subunit 4